MLAPARRALATPWTTHSLLPLFERCPGHRRTLASLSSKTPASTPLTAEERYAEARALSARIYSNESQNGAGGARSGRGGNSFAAVTASLVDAAARVPTRTERRDEEAPSRSESVGLLLAAAAFQSRLGAALAAGAPLHTPSLQHVLQVCYGRPELVRTKYAVWQALLAQGCPIPEWSLSVDPNTSSFTDTLHTITVLLLCNMPVPLPVWSLLFSLGKRKVFEPPLVSPLATAVRYFFITGPRAWDQTLAGNLIETLARFRLSRELYRATSIVLRGSGSNISGSLADSLLRSVASRCSHMSVPMFGEMFFRVAAEMAAKGIRVPSGAPVSPSAFALRALAASPTSNFTMDRKVEKGLFTSGILHKAQSDALKFAEELYDTSSNPWTPVRPFSEFHAELLLDYVKCLLRFGDPARALQLVTSHLKDGLHREYGTRFLNLLLLDSAVKNPALASRYLRMMQLLDLPPDEVTLLNLVKVGLYGSNGTGAAGYITSLSKALDVHPTDRVFGLAVFQAAKYEKWEEVDNLVATAAGLGLGIGSRWAIKVDLFRKHILAQ